MRIKPVFPVANFQDLLIAMSVLFIVVRPRGVIDITPVLHDCLRLAVLLALLPPAARPFVAHVVPKIVIFCTSPVRQGALHGRGGVGGLTCARWRSFGKGGFGLWFLVCELWSLGRLESERSYQVERR